ncbi:transmembrane protein 250-like [Babylonia areolata]|uniref:transmembrane protein 250-like n=1 Tax=Babylonia areolata TaxID=304850 RepID=UPI003FD5320D
MFPLCRRLKTMHGPHSTCLMTAETFWVTFPSRRPQQLRGAFSSKSNRSILFAGHLETIVFLGNYLLTCVFFCVFSLCSFLGFLGVKLCLRFQTNLTLYLMMLDRDPIQFYSFNVGCLCCLHLFFFLSGGFGFLVLSYVDT